MKNVYSFSVRRKVKKNETSKNEVFIFDEDVELVEHIIIDNDRENKRFEVVNIDVIKENAILDLVKDLDTTINSYNLYTCKSVETISSIIKRALENDKKDLLDFIDDPDACLFSIIYKKRLELDIENFLILYKKSCLTFADKVIKYFFVKQKRNMYSINSSLYKALNFYIDNKCVYDLLDLEVLKNEKYIEEIYKIYYTLIVCKNLYKLL